MHYLRAAVAVNLLSAVLLGLSGCSKVTWNSYPPNLVYLDQSQVESSMRRLLLDVWTINDTFDTSETLSGYNREKIISTLRDMEAVADDLGAGAEMTNHLVIDNNIDDFKFAVQAARKAVETEPPNYYLAGQLSGQCLACHAKR